MKAVCVLSWALLACGRTTSLGGPCPDHDGDGAFEATCGGTDCDDTRADVHPGATEVCDGIDNDCDGKSEGGRGTLCLWLTINGERPESELGFRFSPPLDADADGISDLAVGARVSPGGPTPDAYAGLWTSSTGTSLHVWRSTYTNDLFGHATVLGPDVDGDGIADVIVSAPSTMPSPGSFVPKVYAFGVQSDTPLWVREFPNTIAGWHLSRGWDDNDDGVEDVLVGDPGANPGTVMLLSGKTGETLRHYDAPGPTGGFGWFMTAIPDADGDGVVDVLVGNPGADSPTHPGTGAAYLFGSKSGALLHEWYGDRSNQGFGNVVGGISDLDGDGTPEVLVGASGGTMMNSTPGGKAYVYSTGTGAELFHWSAADENTNAENYGRMINRAGDLDGDGVEDIAIGSPWYTAGALGQAGRLEIRSGRTGSVIATLVGQTAGGYFGWHIEPAASLGPNHAPGIVVSSAHGDSATLADCGQVRMYIYGH